MAFEAEYLRPFGHFVSALTDVDVDLPSNAPWVREARFDLPIELSVAVWGETVRLFSGPPTQHLETTFMPVLHRIRVGVTTDGHD